MQDDAHGNHLLIGFSKVAIHLLVNQEVRVTHTADLHATQHGAHNDLDVLVIDFHTLEAVDLLNLIHQ